MPIVGSLILPHGAMVFDGGKGCTASAAERVKALPKTLREDCQSLFQASCEATDLAKATDPDLIFLNTPHGICLSNNHCVYLNNRAKGNAEWNGQWTEYDVDVSLDSKIASELVEHLKREDIPVEGMNAFTSCEAPLRWGEVIPLWFFRDLTAAGVKVVIFSNPLHRSIEAHSLRKLAKVGCSIESFLEGLEKRVLYIASGDLAHTHKTDCTHSLYLPDPRWNIPTSETALPFDLCIEHWVTCTPFGSSDGITGPTKTKEKPHSVVWADSKSTHNFAEQWLSKGMELKNDALSCGIYGFGLLHGILSAQVERKATYDAHLFCRLAPTYYGMIVAAFINRK